MTLPKAAYVVGIPTESQHRSNPLLLLGGTFMRYEVDGVVRMPLVCNSPLARHGLVPCWSNARDKFIWL